MGQDVMMQEMVTGSAEALAAAAGKKFFPKKFAGVGKCISIFGVRHCFFKA